jgi:long-chain acyl-CoA synthetase
VISGGHKIASTEVESVVARMAAVAQVAVVGVPHPVMGEVVKAVVVLKADRACSATEVIEFCAANLTAYKVPRLVEFRDTLPVSPAGKVLKRHLR